MAEWRLLELNGSELDMPLLAKQTTSLYERGPTHCCVSAPSRAILASNQCTVHPALDGSMEATTPCTQCGRTELHAALLIAAPDSPRYKPLRLLEHPSRMRLGRPSGSARLAEQLDSQQNNNMLVAGLAAVSGLVCVIRRERAVAYYACCHRSLTEDYSPLVLMGQSCCCCGAVAAL